MYGQGVFASRPVSSAGSPGKQGRFYMSTDGVSGGSAGTYILFYDYGTGWAQVTSIYGGPGADSITSVELAPNSVTSVELADGSVDSAAIIDGTIVAADLANALKPSTGAGSGAEALRSLGVGAGQALSYADLSANVFKSGLRTALPANNAANDGTWFYATDQDVMYYGAGGTWHRVGSQAGDIIWTLENTARAGYIICSGQAWPGTTGMYADLFAKWSALYPSVLPDFPGRQFVAKGSHADVATLGFSDGLAVANRRPKHKHTKNGAASKTGTVTKFGTVSVSVPGLTQVAGFNGPGGQYHLGTTGSNLLAYSPGAAMTVSDGIGVTDGIGVSDTITIGPQTGAEPVDSSAYIVLNPQVKL